MSITITLNPTKQAVPVQNGQTDSAAAPDALSISPSASRVLATGVKFNPSKPTPPPSAPQFKASAAAFSPSSLELQPRRIIILQSILEKNRSVTPKPPFSNYKPQPLLVKGSDFIQAMNAHALVTKEPLTILMHGSTARCVIGGHVIENSQDLDLSLVTTKSFDIKWAVMNSLMGCYLNHLSQIDLKSPQWENEVTHGPLNFFFAQAKGNLKKTIELVKTADQTMNQIYLHLYLELNSLLLRQPFNHPEEFNQRFLKILEEKENLTLKNLFIAKELIYSIYASRPLGMISKGSRYGTLVQIGHEVIDISLEFIGCQQEQRLATSSVNTIYIDLKTFKYFMKHNHQLDTMLKIERDIRLMRCTFYEQDNCTKPLFQLAKLLISGIDVVNLSKIAARIFNESHGMDEQPSELFISRMIDIKYHGSTKATIPIFMNLLKILITIDINDVKNQETHSKTYDQLIRTLTPHNPNYPLLASSNILSAHPEIAHDLCMLLEGMLYLEALCPQIKDQFSIKFTPFPQEDSEEPAASAAPAKTPPKFKFIFEGFNRKLFYIPSAGFNINRWKKAWESVSTKLFPQKLNAEECGSSVSSESKGRILSHYDRLTFLQFCGHKISFTPLGQFQIETALCLFGKAPYIEDLPSHFVSLDNVAIFEGLNLIPEQVKIPTMMELIDLLLQNYKLNTGKLSKPYHQWFTKHIDMWIKLDPKVVATILSTFPQPEKELLKIAKESQSIAITSILCNLNSTKNEFKLSLWSMIETILPSVPFHIVEMKLALLKRICIDVSCFKNKESMRCFHTLPDLLRPLHILSSNATQDLMHLAGLIIQKYGDKSQKPDLNFNTILHQFLRLIGDTKIHPSVVIGSITTLLLKSHPKSKPELLSEFYQQFSLSEDVMVQFYKSTLPQDIKILVELENQLNLKELARFKNSTLEQLQSSLRLLSISDDATLFKLIFSEIKNDTGCFPSIMWDIATFSLSSKIPAKNCLEEVFKHLILFPKRFDTTSPSRLTFFKELTTYTANKHSSNQLELIISVLEICFQNAHSFNESETEMLIPFLQIIIESKGLKYCLKPEFITDLNRLVRVPINGTEKILNTIFLLIDGRFPISSFNMHFINQIYNVTSVLKDSITLKKALYMKMKSDIGIEKRKMDTEGLGLYISFLLDKFHELPFSMDEQSECIGEFLNIFIELSHMKMTSSEAGDLLMEAAAGAKTNIDVIKSNGVQYQEYLTLLEPFLLDHMTNIGADELLYAIVKIKTHLNKREIPQQYLKQYTKDIIDFIIKIDIAQFVKKRFLIDQPLKNLTCRKILLSECLSDGTSLYAKKGQPKIIKENAVIYIMSFYNELIEALNFGDFQTNTLISLVIAQQFALAMTCSNSYPVAIHALTNLKNLIHLSYEKSVFLVESTHFLQKLFVPFSLDIAKMKGVVIDHRLIDLISCNIITLFTVSYLIGFIEIQLSNQIMIDKAQVQGHITRDAINNWILNQLLDEARKDDFDSRPIGVELIRFLMSHHALKNIPENTMSKVFVIFRNCIQNRIARIETQFNGLFEFNKYIITTINYLFEKNPVLKITAHQESEMFLYCETKASDIVAYFQLELRDCKDQIKQTLQPEQFEALDLCASSIRQNIDLQLQVDPRTLLTMNCGDVKTELYHRWAECILQNSVSPQTQSLEKILMGFLKLQDANEFEKNSYILSSTKEFQKEIESTLIENDQSNEKILQLVRHQILISSSYSPSSTVFLNMLSNYLSTLRYISQQTHQPIEMINTLQSLFIRYFEEGVRSMHPSQEEAILKLLSINIGVLVNISYTMTFIECKLKKSPPSLDVFDQSDNQQEGNTLMIDKLLQITQEPDFRSTPLFKEFVDYFHSRETWRLNEATFPKEFINVFVNCLKVRRARPDEPFDTPFALNRNILICCRCYTKRLPKLHFLIATVLHCKVKSVVDEYQEIFETFKINKMIELSELADRGKIEKHIESICRFEKLIFEKMKTSLRSDGLYLLEYTRIDIQNEIDQTWSTFTAHS